MGLSSLDCLCGAYNLIRFGQARELCRSLARHKRKFGSTESLNVGRVGRSLAESVSRGQRVAQEMGRFDEV